VTLPAEPAGQPPELWRAIMIQCALAAREQYFPTRRYRVSEKSDKNSVLRNLNICTLSE
jgi:hypothetical protein